ncbi:hypothetical protein SAMN04487988_102183 [Algoriphagus hitonicola]|uniref:Uncharacterized protein n=1 Tax=Algoriphagus hitonicola TaxID=435880 RepID=A0A1I2QFY5_9BACT|nr:hypothetical protein SAMN04487988_102183 [Algoriphagus hitonicola]
MAIVTNRRQWQFSVDRKNAEEAKGFTIFDLRGGWGIDELFN